MPVRPRLPGFRRSMPHADRGLALSRLQRGPRLNPPRRSLVRCPATQCVRGHACAPASSFATLSGSLVTGLTNSQYSLAPVLASNRRRREASRSRTWGGRSVVSRCSSKAGTASPNTLDSKRAPTLNQLNSRGRPGRAGSMASASTRSRAGEEGVSCRIIRPGTCRTSDAIDPATPGDGPVGPDQWRQHQHAPGRGRKECRVGLFARVPVEHPTPLTRQRQALLFTCYSRPNSLDSSP